MKKEFKSYDAYGVPCYYAICPKCKYGFGVTKYGMLRRHIRHTRQGKIVCEGTGRHYTGKKKYE